jgi:SAM-dependent methyltransferase
MERVHEQILEAQFGPRAHAYVDSAVHARGPDLDAVGELLHARPPRRGLDIGSGGGHLAYLMARHARGVTATDLSSDMLAAVAATAAERGLTNVETVAARAERLPFEAGEFDFVGCRFSAHHWRDFEVGLREARRVLEAGGRAVFIDAVSSGRALLDTHLQAVELLRDTSHVRDYSAAEWLAGLARAGFVVQACRTWRLRMDFPTWTARMRTPADNVTAIRALQAAAAAETRAYFAIEEDGSFLLDVLMLEAQAI